MTPMRTGAAVGLAVLMAGCAVPDSASRGALFDSVAPPEAASGPAQHQPLHIRAVNVQVPDALQVSEANRYYPSGDIVWRGDAPGDRHAQVQAIFETAMARGTAAMSRGTPAVLDIEVLRFHALTEKARYTVGGVHAIRFAFSLRHAETGVPLGDRRVVKANLRGFGGQRALDAEREGLTQKVRITDHLAHVIQTELVAPGA
ncbi:DUF6778 family protein [Roseobacter sinensis]|uniref:Lipoprotein n=1 Tax=Roseobacter sinensis TaxID=2931391 RepID=A0ABT3BBV4_9RHOB|nr:DUF6778 family protein [Roseobacter sp. WL0113]MCV3271025.1 hypothetical protein [Roseobacter sp. WL0113]